MVLSEACWWYSFSTLFQREKKNIIEKKYNWKPPTKQNKKYVPKFAKGLLWRGHDAADHIYTQRRVSPYCPVVYWLWIFSWSRIFQIWGTKFEEFQKYILNATCRLVPNGLGLLDLTKRVEAQIFAEQIDFINWHLWPYMAYMTYE